MAHTYQCPPGCTEHRGPWPRPGEVIIYQNVNEEGEVYDQHDSLDAALAVQAEFPNDTVRVVRRLAN